jgi:hypothetical protein
MRFAATLRRLLVLPALLAAAPALAQFAEAEVKAAFIYNLAKYAEWPEPATPDRALRICVVGEPSPLAEALARLEGKTARGLRIEVRLGMKIAALRPCHVAVLSGAGPEQLRQLEAGDATLSVGEGSAFVDAGGMIGLLLVDKRVQFEANVGAARRAGIHLSAQLLKLARRVQE